MKDLLDVGAMVDVNKGSEWYTGKSEIQWTTAMQKARDAWAAAKANKTTSKYSPKLVAIMDESLKRASWHELQHHLRDPTVPFTLCHGDFHASNMYVSVREGADGKEELQWTLYDWSEVGPWEPMADLGQCFISDVHHSLFAQTTRLVVKEYWATLMSNGVSEAEYSFDKCWESFCRAGVERWIWLFAILPSFPGIPEAAVQYWHDQLLAFIELHGDRQYYQLKPVVCF